MNDALGRTVALEAALKFLSLRELSEVVCAMHVPAKALTDIEVDENFVPTAALPEALL
jgi:hypothetical protein